MYTPRECFLLRPLLFLSLFSEMFTVLLTRFITSFVLMDNIFEAKVKIKANVFEAKAKVKAKASTFRVSRLSRVRIGANVRIMVRF